MLTYAVHLSAGMRDKYAFIDTVGADEQTHQHVPQHYLVTAKDAQARAPLLTYAHVC
jgi:hypothetical protein